MNEDEKKGQRKPILKKTFVFIFLPGTFFLLAFLIYFIYTLPETVTSFIHEELDRYEFGPYQVETIAVRHNRAVLGPIEFGSNEDKLEVSKIQLNYTFGGIQKGEIDSISISGADLHLNRHGNWNLSGLDGILKGIANYRNANPSESSSKIPEIEVNASLLTLHFNDRQFSFPLKLTVTEEQGNIFFKVKTNLSRDKIQEFKLEFKPETTSLSLKQDAFSFRVSQAIPFLKKLGLKSSSGLIDFEDISIFYSPEKFTLEGKCGINDFTAHIQSGKEPIVISFSNMDKVNFTHDFLNPEKAMNSKLNFTNFSFTHGSTLFNADKTNSHLIYNLDKKRLSADSTVTGFHVEHDGHIVEAKSPVSLNLVFSDNSLESYKFSGDVDVSYSEIISGSTKVNIQGSTDSLKINGIAKDISLPDGSIKTADFNFSSTKDNLNLSSNIVDLNTLGGLAKGSADFDFKKNSDGVSIEGNIKNIVLADSFNLKGSFSLKEKDGQTDLSLNDFKLSEKDEFLSSNFEVKVKIPQSFEDFIKAPFQKTVHLKTEVLETQFGDYSLSPFSIIADGNKEEAVFVVSQVQSPSFPYLNFTSLAAGLNFDKQELKVAFDTHLDIEKIIPEIKGRLEPFSTTLLIKNMKDMLHVSVEESLPKSKLRYQKEHVSLSSEIEHKNRLSLKILKSDPMKGEISSFSSSTKFNDVNFAAGQLALNKGSMNFSVQTKKPFSLDSWLKTSLEGNISSNIEELWLDTNLISGVSTDFPFTWSPVRNFEKATNKITIKEMIANGIAVENIKLLGQVDGLNMIINEDIKLNDKVSVTLNQESGWDIPKEISDGKKSPLPFLLKLIINPDYDFRSIGSITLPETGITDLVNFAQIVIGIDTVMKGKASGKVNFKLDRTGFENPGEFHIKNLNLFTKDKDDHSYLIQGLNTKLKFSSVLDQQTEDSQLLTLKSFVGPGLKVDNTRVKFKIFSPTKLKLDKVETTWCDGLIELADLTINPKVKSFDCVIHASKVEIEKVMELIKGVECEANGKLYGRLHLSLRNGKIVDQNGFLISEPATEMNMKLNEENLIYKSVKDPTTRKLMKNLKVQYFKILFKGGKLEEQITHFNLKGASAVGDPPNPLDLSVNLNGPVIYYLQTPMNERGIKEFIENMKREKK